MKYPRVKEMSEHLRTKPVKPIKEIWFLESKATPGPVRTRTSWTEVITDIKADGQPRKVSGLTRGQVASLYRRAKNSGLRVKAFYKNGYVILMLRKAATKSSVGEK